MLSLVSAVTIDTIMVVFYKKYLSGTGLLLLYVGVYACVIITILGKLFDTISQFYVDKGIENNGLCSSVHSERGNDMSS